MREYSKNGENMFDGDETYIIFSDIILPTLKNLVRSAIPLNFKLLFERFERSKNRLI